MYIADGQGRRKQALKGAIAGIGAVMLWLVVFWNVYYRGLIPIYAERRQMRRRRRLEQFGPR